MAGCATVSGRLQAAGEAQAEASLVPQAIAEASKRPKLPDDCRKKERAGVQLGDRLDVASIKYDRALGRANARIERCAEWHDGAGVAK